MQTNSPASFRLRIGHPTADAAALLLVLAGALHQGQQSCAAVLLTYDISAANAGIYSTDTPTTASEISAGDLTLTGATAFSSAGTYAATDWGTSPTTPDLGKYMEFTVAPTAGNQITFASLNGSVWRGAGNPIATSHAANKFELRSSIDGFGSTIGSVVDISLSDDAVQVPFGINLSSLGTRDQSTIFRFYAYDQANQFNAGLANSGSMDGTGNNLILNGTVTPVPEPPVMTGIVAFGLLGFAIAGKTRSWAWRN